MKGLAARLKNIFSLALCSTIGIAMTWSQALGNGTPDEILIPVPEPSSLALLAAGFGAVAIACARKGRR